ncbi:MAG: hypothetical protein ABSB35_22225, partial [Bryobacteraceae bacterium]
MEFSAGRNDNPIVLSFDGDLTIREGDWLRQWNSLGVGAAHEVWVGTGASSREFRSGRLSCAGTRSAMFV